MNIDEMKEKFLEDFEDALEHAKQAYWNHDAIMNLRYVNQSNDFAFISYHFGIITFDEYLDFHNQVDKFDLTLN